MILNGKQCRFDAESGNEFSNLFSGEVGQTDGFCFAFVYQFFKAFPGSVNITYRMMQQKQVCIVDAKTSV